MKKQNKLNHYLFLLALILPQITLSAQTINIPDSLLTLDYVYEYTYSDPEKAQQILEIIRKQKTVPVFKLDIVEGDFYYNNRKHKEALEFYKRALNSDSVRNNDIHYMQQLHRMISCYDGMHDGANKTIYVKLLLDKADETGNKEMRSIALMNMGKTIYDEQDKARGYELIKEAIREMESSDYSYKYDNLRYNYNTLIRMQQRDNLFEEALETLNELERIVNESAENERYMEGHNEKEMKTLLAWRANILSFLDRYEEADEAYRQWQAIDADFNPDNQLISTYLLRAKRFDEVIKIFKPVEQFYKQQTDTISYHMKTIKRLVGRAYEGKGDYRQATGYYRELAVITDSIKEREQRSAAVELAIAYETHEKEIKLQEQAGHLKLRNVLLLTSGIVITLLLLLLYRSIKHARTIRNKNKLMASTIEELLVYKDELFNVKEDLNTAGNKQEHPEQQYPGKDIPEDELLFERLDNSIVREKLYLNPNLSREDLMKLIGVNKNRFGQILQQYTGSNTATYINNKRLEYAARSLKTHPGYTIAAIAELSGIPNVPTFNRLFKAKYGMTPTEFRNSL